MRQTLLTMRAGPGSMVILDNRATHHRALNDYQGQRRLMHWITIEGEPLPAFGA
ncbi:MAG: hypothetical protein ACKVHU_13045 [Acidimicrobiales bacterium]|jgi:taurine dioxygenase